MAWIEHADTASITESEGTPTRRSVFSRKLVRNWKTNSVRGNAFGKRCRAAPSKLVCKAGRALCIIVIIVLISLLGVSSSLKSRMAVGSAAMKEIGYYILPEIHSIFLNACKACAKQSKFYTRK